ncbi:type II toxin-antitoxin system prevent-host-death family antitoxin [Streptomyces broussonetiae]|uniref:Type II toxin-antitoxin system prevent-host-death family antitoxin n=1 Tax=Streptomyces broussonetiae TaxID=2686304 RepID=A0A6I6N442_9ACTN|nr:type II toxin-antitoxin system prevent-host-death family antitoxin [Streptomyces broussonetiae]
MGSWIRPGRSRPADLVRRAAHGRGTSIFTDHGHVAAFLVPPQVEADLEYGPTGSRNSSRLPTGSSE